MRILNDQKNNLIVVSFELVNKAGNYVDKDDTLTRQIKKHLFKTCSDLHTPFSPLSLSQCIETINEWSSPDIDKYIFINNKNKSKFLGSYLNDKYILQKNIEAGKYTTEFNQYYYFDTSRPNIPLVGTQVVSYSPTQLISTCLEFLVVNPNLTNQGIGSRILKSSIEHHNFIANDMLSPKNSWIVGSVHKENIPSKQLLAKQNFQPINSIYTPKENQHYLYMGLNTLQPSADINKILSSQYYELLDL